MVAVWCGSRVEYQSKKEPSDPVVLFDLDSLGIDAARFLEDLNESFNTLEWDHYDVRREQIEILRSAIGEVSSYAKLFTDYYSGQLKLETLLASLPAQTEETVARLHTISPYRRRRTSRFTLSAEQSQWRIQRESNAPVSQSVSTTDYRSLQRVFAETSIHVVEHPEFVRLLKAIGDLVLQADHTAKEMTLTCWQTGIIATPQRAGSNAPEGIHQDGADYIVSALVTARENIAGGVSRVFGPDKKTEHLNVTLRPGQGIFQADAGSSLWHDVTPIKVEEPGRGDGIRNLFGFDVHICKRG